MNLTTTRRTLARVRCLIASVLICAMPAAGQTDTLRQQPPTPPAAIVIDGDTIAYLGSYLGPFSPEQRAAAVNAKLEKLRERGYVDSVLVLKSVTGVSLVVDSMILMAVTDEDAALAGKTTEELADEYAASIRDHLDAAIARHRTSSLVLNGAIAVGLLVAFVLAFWGMGKLFPFLYSRVERWEGTLLRPARVGRRVLLSAQSISSGLIVLVKGVRLTLSLALLYFFVTFLLGLFPWTRHWSMKPVLMGGFLAILTITGSVVLFRTVNSLFVALIRRVDGWKGTLIRPARLKSIEFLSQDRVAELVSSAIMVLRFFSLAALAYIAITLLFSFFTFTETWAETLLGYILTPLRELTAGFIAYLPNLFTILVIAYVTRYVIKFVRRVFEEIGKGTLTLPGFYAEWASPTYKILRFLILAFAGVVIFPHLPGSDSPAFQGVSVFLGVLFSLGSTSAIANIVAGIVLTYMRPFRIGDRVKIADTIGDIQEKTLLVTRVRTIKNVDVTIPNAMVLGSHIINFSSSARDPGLILHTGVTIGYEVPWQKVHGLLLKAAETTPRVLKEPKPFVLQTALDESYVSYELNVHTDQPNSMAVIYSDLHQNIQDTFNQAGIEILSPRYSALRDGNRTTIPEEYLPKSYRAPGFRLFPPVGEDRPPREGA